MKNSASERSSRSNKCRKCVGAWTLSKRGLAQGPPKEDPPPPQSNDFGFWDDESMEKMSLESEDELWDDESMAPKAPYPKREPSCSSFNDHYSEREPDIWKREPSELSFKEQYPKREPSCSSLNDHYPEREPRESSFEERYPKREPSESSFKEHYPKRESSNSSSKAHYPEREEAYRRWNKIKGSVPCPKKKPCNKHWQVIKEAVNRHKNERPPQPLATQIHGKKKLPLGTIVFDIYQNHPEFESYSQKKSKTSKLVKSPEGQQINNETKTEPRICNTPEESLAFDLYQKYPKGIPWYIYT